MNNNITLKELEEKLKKADKLKDIESLTNDINEGKQALKSIDYKLKLDYTRKIEKNYSLWVMALNVGMNLRV